LKLGKEEDAAPGKKETCATTSKPNTLLWRKQNIRPEKKKSGGAMPENHLFRMGRMRQNCEVNTSHGPKTQNSEVAKLKGRRVAIGKRARQNGNKKCI